MEFSVERAISRAIELRIHESLQWKKLLIYGEGFPQKNYESAIISEHFFLSKIGRNNARAELEATIAAIFDVSTPATDQHAQCRFRGRYVWIKRVLDLDDTEVPSVACKNFKSWALNGNVDSVSLIFATGYLGNPASYYGHTLLKMNSAPDAPDSVRLQSSLLEHSINFGAIVPEDDNPLKYLLFGIFGGYEASFSDIDYAYHTHLYGEVELRDLWEYRLKLSQYELDLLLGHVWEVLGMRYRYYFLNRNCAYRMGEVIQIISGVEVVDDGNPWSMPASLVKATSRQSEQNGRQLVASSKYRPSRQSRLYEKYSKLSSEEKRRVNKIISVGDSNDTYWQVYNQHVVDTLIDYYRYADAADILREGEAAALHSRALALRYQLPVGQIDTDPQSPTPPDSSRDPSYLQVRTTYSKGLGIGYGVKLRPAYYDPLDAGALHADGSQLIMGHLDFTVFGEEVRVDSVDLFDVRNNNYRKTGLEGDNTHSWRLAVGWKGKSLSCDSCLALTARADVGQTWSLGRSTFLGGFLGGVVSDNTDKSGNFAASMSGHIYSRISEKTNLWFEYEHREVIDKSVSTIEIFTLSVRYEIEKNIDLRLSLRSHDSAEAGVGIGYYW